MKKISLILLVLFYSCEPQETNNKIVSQIEGRIVYEYTIDSCQYLGELGHDDSKNDYLTHKGNCINSIHNNK